MVKGNPLTIILITPKYPPALCGVGDYTLKIQQQFLQGHQNAIVITQLPNGLWFDAGNDFGRAGSFRDILDEGRYDLKRSWLLWQYTPNGFSSLGLPFFLPFTLLQLRLSGWRQAVFFHEVTVRFWGYGLQQALLSLGQRMIANALSAITTLSFTSIALYAGYFAGKKPVIIPVGANILPHSPISRVRGERPVIVCFANRADEALCQALAQIQPKMSIQLVLVGACKAAQRSAINRWLLHYGLSDSATITGILSPFSLSQWLAMAAIFIQPQPVARGEQGGVSAKNGTIMAAMAHGLAIITTRGDMTEDALFVHNQNMVFVAYGNAAEYEQALWSLITDPLLATQLGDAALKTYREQFAWPVIADSLSARLFSSNQPF